MSILRIKLIKTDKCCFISDLYATDSYSASYHQSKIKHLFFDGEKPQVTHCLNWFRIKTVPTKIQRLISGKTINARWEIANPDKLMPALNIPKVIEYESDLETEIKESLGLSVFEALYTYCYDVAPDTYEDVEYEIDTILEIDNYIEPTKFEYTALHKESWSEEVYTINDKHIEHQVLDKIIFPEIVLSNCPSKLTSKQVYDITRQYIKDNLDTKVATITSDYDFCFEVHKIIPLLKPETLSYQNLFARTKKERNKIHYTTKTYKQEKVFEMTHNQSNYKDYTAIPEILGQNQEELKQKLDEWLETCIALINKPLQLCPHCNGTGYVQEKEEDN